MHNNLLAITCLLLASKFYEIDDNLVMSSDVQRKFKRLNLKYTEYQRAELQVLEKHNWDMHVTTILDYVHVFLSLGIIQNTDI